MASQEEERILSIKVRYQDAIDGILKYQKQVEELKARQNELKEELESGAIGVREYNAEMADLKVRMAEAKDGVRVLEKEARNNLKTQKEQEGSLKSLRAELSNATKAYDELSREEREGAKGKELQEHINTITDELKGAEEETQRFYRNVGNYADSIIKATEANLPFVQEIHNSITAMSGFREYMSGVAEEFTNIIQKYREGAAEAKIYSGAQRAAAASSNLFSTALKLLKVALISTGIGAIVVALGLLVVYLTKTQKGVEVVSKVMASLGTAIDVIIDRTSKLGESIIKVFTGDFSGAAKSAKQAFSGIGDEIVRETKLAWELKEALNQLEKQEIMLSMRRSANKALIEELKKASDDTTKSTKERMEAIEKAYQLEKQDLELQTQIAESRLANTLGYKQMNDEVRALLEQIKAGSVTADDVIGKLGLSESTVEDLRAFREEFNALQELAESSYTRQTEQQNKLNSIRKEGQDIAKERAEKELEAVRQAEDAMLSLVMDGIEKQRQQITLQYDREIADLKKKLAEEQNLTARAKDAIIQTIKAKEQMKNQELAKLGDDELQQAIDKEQKRIALLLEGVKSGSEQEYQLKLAQLQKQEEAEMMAMEREVQSVEEREAMKLAIRQKYNLLNDELIAQHNNDIIQKEQEAIRLEYETKIAEAGNNELLALQLKVEQKQMELDTLQQLEGESLEAFNLRKLEMQNEFNDAKQDLADKEVEIELTKQQAMADIMGGIGQLADALGEKNTAFAKLSKVLALAEIAINTGKALAAGIAQAQSVPFPGNIAAIATTVATILANIATATKTVNSAKFATGGLVEGAGSGTSDSIPAMLSNGESVMTAAATSMFSPMLSAFNQMGGGVPINVLESGNSAMGEEMLANAVAKGMRLAPRPVVSVEEFNTVSKRVDFVDNIGNL